tara:strand:+ start:2170 stop:4191 length:2022 start_codon:yes stop_codon:yes gene_type:complete
MSTYDYGFFEALTGPMQAAGDIQGQREKRKMQQMQMMQQQRQMDLQEVERKKAMQSQLSSAQQAAQQLLYTKNNFSRNKDVDDFRNWHKDLSGWADIQEVLRSHGSVANAQISGNLDYLVAEYKAKLLDNPISRRVNKNKASLELYKSYQLDEGGNDKFLTRLSNTRFNAFVNEETDNFLFTGGRADYLDESTKARYQSDKIDLEEVLRDNYSAVWTDIAREQQLTDKEAANLSDVDMLSWLEAELHHKDGYFGEKVLYGEKEMDLDFGSELKSKLNTTKALGIKQGKDYFSNFNLDKKETFHKYFNKQNMGDDWNGWGGYDPNWQTKSYVGTKAMFAKGTQVASSGRVLTNQGIENTITNLLFNGNDYDSKTRELQDVNTSKMFTSRGSQITQEDQAGNWLTAQFYDAEDEMDFTLNGYFVGMKARAKDGTEIILTDVTNESDRKKLINEYGGLTFEPVILAELIDFDYLSHNDAYYKELDLTDASVLMAMNEAIDPSKMNLVAQQTATYKENLANKDREASRTEAAKQKLSKMLNTPINSVPNLISGYDQTLTVGLGMSGVPAVKIQQVTPMIIADLYVDSQQERTYPHVFNPEEKDPEKLMVAETPGQYMAYSTKILKNGLITGNPAFEGMLKAIKTGEYDVYSQTQINKQNHTSGRRLAKQIIKHQRGH